MRKQRILAALLALVMVVGLLPAAAFAADEWAEIPVTDADAQAELPAPDDGAARLADATDEAELLAEPDAAAGNVVGTHYSDNENAYEIYPVPHSVVYSSDHSSFEMTTDVNVVVGDRVDTYTTAFVEEILTRFDRTMTTSDAVAADKTNIVLSVHGDSDAVAPASVNDLWTAADKFSPYLLKADNSTNEHGVITIIGKDTDEVYYGVATLQMMFTSFNGEKFLNVVIEDYSNTIFRGFIEGFYGGFSYEQRESQMRGIRDVKGNMYVFASKTDAYHGAQWSTLYPDAELNQIKHLVAVGKEMKVNYTWSVHIGKGGVLNGVDNNADAGAADFVNQSVYTDRLTKMKAKFQQLYDAGVRSFNVLNDDYNSGTHRVQVKFLNDINAWLTEKGDCMPLIYCCAGYNTAWCGNDGQELKDLAALDDDIYLYWTGGDVNSPIDQDNTNWAYTRSGQPIVTWINYPCSEHCGKRGVFLGDINHYVKDANGLTHHYGLLANPMDWAEANKVAYFQLLSWAWNRDNYTSYLSTLWEDCFKYLQPEVAGAYRTIARNVSNAPNSGRVAYFPESEYIKEELAAVQTAALAGENLLNNTNAQTLLDEFANIHAAIQAFRDGCDNPALVTELDPWLNSLDSVVTAGEKAIAAVNALSLGNDANTWNLFSEGAVALGRWDDFSSNDNANRSGVKLAGSLRLQPFAETMLNYVKEAMAQAFNPGGGLTGELTPTIRLGGVDRPDDDNARKMVDGDPDTRADYTTNQVVDDYFGVDLGSIQSVSAIDILQGQNDIHHDYFHKATLEYSTDNEHWTTLVTKVNSHHIAVEDLDIAARYVRLRLLEKGYPGKDDFYTHIREFTVTTKAAGLLYTDAANADGVTAQQDGEAYVLTVPSLTLAAGEYVGLRLPELMGIQTIATTGTLPDGVKLQYSVNGAVWTADAPAQTTLMGYVRLVNGGSGEAALENVTLTASKPIRTELSFVRSSGVSIYSGSWDNVVDGNRSTLVHTYEKQAYGQYAIFDLGAKQPVKDVTVFVPDSGEDIPHNLDIFIGNSSDPAGDWTLIGELRGDGYARVEPQPYRFFECNGNSQSARYVKLAIAAVEAKNWFRINELEVNTTVPQDAPLKPVSSSSGEAASADDGDLLTFFTPDAGAGYWEKLLQAPTAFDSVTILRGEAGASATVKVQRNNSWVNVGRLTQAATPVSLKDGDPITGVRIEWTENDVPAIAEVIFAGEAVPTGEAPTLYPNIYEQPANPDGVTVANGTAAGNVPLPDRVSITTSGGTTTEVPVTWSCGSYDAITPATYTFVGEFDLADALLTNPGCFTLTSNVTVRPAEGSVTPEGDLIVGSSRVFASGISDSKSPNNVRVEAGEWGSNAMKTAYSSNLIDGAAAWIVVDLKGDGTAAAVNSITEISIQPATGNKAWPTKYVVQVAGDGFTPVDYTTINGNKSAVDPGIDANTFTGDNAKDAFCWTTIATYDKPAEDVSGKNKKDTLTAEQLALIPDNPRYLRLFFTEVNVNANAASAINLAQIIVKGTRTAPADDTDISSITPVTLTGVRGDEWASLNAPTHVVATLADSTKVRIPVAWNSTGYDPDAQANQTFTGTLTLPSGVTNSQNVQPQLTVTLSDPPDVTGYTVTPSRVTAQHRTTFNDLKPSLPAKAVLQFSNGATRSLPITWVESSYDSNSLVDQTVRGTVTRPWSKTEYEVTVLVRLDPILATSVTLSQNALTLYANESNTNHTATLTATVGGEDASDKTVTWSSSDVRVAAVDNGTVTGIGPGTATIYAIAHDGSRVSASCEVTVKWKLEGNVTVSGGPRIGATLSADLHSFVQDAKKSIDIQWWRKGKTDTDFTAISGATEKEYTVAEAAANVDAQYKVVITGKGLYEGSSESLPITMTKLAGLPLKAVPTFENVSAEGAKDGAITGLFKGRVYEYKQVANGTDDPGETGWTEFSDLIGDETASDSTYGSARITGLGVGNYAVRRAADDLHEAGPHRTVTIAVRGAANVVVHNPQTFTGGIVTIGRSQIPEGSTVRLNVTPDEGYELVPGSLKGIPNVGEAVVATADATTEGLYTFTMPRGIISVTISAEFRLKTYTITHDDLFHITCGAAPHDHTATHGEKFSITLTPEEGYEMKPTTITVNNVDTNTAFTDYTYLPDETDPAKRVLTFTHGVTCNLIISGEADLKTYVIDDQLVDLTCDMGDKDHHKVTHNAALTITITPAAGYILPAAKEDISITMGGAAFTDFTYTVVDDTHAQISIAENKIHGDLVISAAAGIPLTSVAIHGAAQVGERLTADLRPSNATVTCKWTITAEDGTEETVTGDALIVPADAEGKTIRLEVTGTGRYRGTLTTDPTGAVTPAIADKSALRAAYDDGLTVANDNYTASTWDAFQKALGDAAAVLDTAAATQAEIDDALAVLTAARAGLKKQSSSSGGSSSRPSTSTATETRDDGSKVTTVTKPDGSVTETVTQPDGTKSETVTTKDGDVTITVTDPEGEELVKAEIPAAIPEPETKFEDVDTTPWAEEAIHKMAGLELVNGTGGNKYSPVAPMTRGSLATVLHRLSQGKTDYETAFKDVAQGKYYTEGVAWAAKAKVVTGYTTDVFAPDDVITREQLAVMLARYAKLIGMDTKADVKALDQFADGENTGSWAADGVAWCVENGILKGKGQNDLDPTANVTRAEVAVMLDRFIALIK